MRINKDFFGKNESGKDIYSFTLANSNGLTAKFINKGATLVSLEVPDKNGEKRDIVLGYDALQKYYQDGAYLGCVVGRYANRICKGKFNLHGKEYQLNINNNGNHLHGGNEGFNAKLWEAETFQNNQETGIIFSYTSPDGEENYPGNLNCKVVYTLTDDNELKIHYEAETDQLTIVNLTNHSYFNLEGHNSGQVLNHVVTINSDSITTVDSTAIPTGEIKDIKKTAFDFTSPKAIGEQIDEVPGGYDHNFVLDNGGEIKQAALVYAPGSGIQMETFTDQPGMQFYTGNFLEGIKGKNGAEYNPQSGFCLETQKFPDSPNHENFPSCSLKPGQKYEHNTIYKFSLI